MVTVSVIIPTYNAERTIVETIKSVQHQTFKDLEIIIIDDGSEDNTLSILSNLEEKRLTIYSSEHQGVSSARNLGITKAQGKWIAFLDADDLWTVDKIEKQVQVLQNNPQAKIAYSWTSFIDEKGQLLWEGKPLYFEGNVYNELLIENFLASGSNALIEKKAIMEIGKFDSNLTIGEDWEFYVRLAKKFKFSVVPERQILYRYLSSSSTSKLDSLEEQLLITVDKIFINVPSQLQPGKSQTLSKVYGYCVQKYLQNMQHNYPYLRKIVNLLWKLITIYPKALLDNYTQGLIRGTIKQSFLILFRYHPSRY
ncbi:glycosyltransferase family 2 protein [Crocosphaera sp.]|uniref:glycosyltransferase family 2 protein n=1 Tax=Crocosphaera sp. TaxID=2729996 RepID=UPI003F26CCDE|nr:glycosyltransferase [Crocosphaera sp.]